MLLLKGATRDERVSKNGHSRDNVRRPVMKLSRVHNLKQKIIIINNNIHLYPPFAPLLSVTLFLSILVISQPLATSNNNNDTRNLGKSSLGKNLFHEVISTTNDGHYSKTFSFPSSPNLPLEPNVSGASYDNRFVKSRSTHGRLLRSSSFYSRIHRKIASTFVPSHYLSSMPSVQKVSSQGDFVRFSIYSAIQDLSTSLRSVLATQRVLEGIGVGRVGATSLSASLNFIVRDGVGMITSLLFNSLASSKFRADIKRWRLFADLIVDLGITLEVAATLVPHTFFLPMICIGNICKAMCGVAAGACGGAIDLYWATGNGDISEVNAKFSAQRTITGGLGLLLGAIFARYITKVPQSTVWSIYVLLTFLHIYANIQCMRLIKFNYLNKPRLDILMSRFFQQLSTSLFETTEVADHRSSSDYSKLTTNDYLDTPDQVSKVEPLLFFPRFFSFYHNVAPPVKMGVSFNDFVKHSCYPLQEIQNTFDDVNKGAFKEAYLISPGICEKSNSFCVLVVIIRGADKLDVMRAYFHASLLSHTMQANHLINVKSRSLDEDMLSKLRFLDKKVLLIQAECWETFISQTVSAGWDITKSDLASEGYRVQFKHAEELGQ